MRLETPAMIPGHDLSVLRALILGAALITLGGCAAFADVDPEEPGVQTDPTARPVGTQLNDQRIESVGHASLDALDAGFGDTHVSIVAFNGIVLLAGQVNSEDQKRMAEEALAKIENVRRIYNELEVAGPISFLTRSSDTVITSKVKSKLLASQDVPATRVKVITENGVVYLMGLIRRLDADAAVEIARNTGGVRRVVRVFEYVD